MTLLIEQSRKAAPDVSLDALNEAAQQLIVMEGTPIVSDTYSNLMGSDDLAIIESQAVKNTMSSFFGQARVGSYSRGTADGGIQKCGCRQMGHRH